jgi:selenoprotein W-related protein
VPRPRVEIVYCRRCRFVLRAGWLAQELLLTLGDVVGELALVPGDGGVFEVWVDGERVFDRAQAGRFPESKELKQLVRDRVAPGRDLGHSDGPSAHELAPEGDLGHGHEGHRR